MEDFFPDFGPIEEVPDYLEPILAIEAQCPRDGSGTLIPSELDFLLASVGVTYAPEMEVWRYFVRAVTGERLRASVRRMEDSGKKE
ncbi:MAG: hypothetical protein AAF604_04590 [Acidobacteriota bacterium]